MPFVVRPAKFFFGVSTTLRSCTWRRVAMHMARHVSGDAGRLFRICRRGLSSAPVFTKRILLVWHSRTGLARQMSDAAEMGAHAAAEEMGCGQSDFSVLRRRARDATVEDVLGSDGYIFCGPVISSACPPVQPSSRRSATIRPHIDRRTLRRQAARCSSFFTAATTIALTSRRPHGLPAAPTALPLRPARMGAMRRGSSKGSAVGGGCAPSQTQSSIAMASRRPPARSCAPKLAPRMRASGAPSWVD